jgi:hypothetical protein
MIENNKIDDYPEVEDYLKLFIDDDNFLLTFNEKGFSITINKLNHKLLFTDSTINELIIGNKIEEGIKYHGSSGFTIKKYTEICVSINHPDYTFLNIPEWNTSPIQFGIGDFLCEISLASPLFVLLLEPIYRDSDFQYDFQKYATIKIIASKKDSEISNITKALYYLNSSILKKIGFIASVHHLEIANDDPLDLWNNEIEEIFDKIKSNKILIKPDLKSIEPLAFYNKAIESEGDDKFLHLYRIFEFFMNRSRIKKLKQLRNDTSYSEEDIIEYIDNKNEEKLLINLISESLSNRNQIKNKLLNFAFEKSLIRKKDIKTLATTLYKYRNSIIHAKETQINQTVIPDLFIRTSGTDLWIIILNDIAIEIIKKYNKTSG